MDLEQHLKQQSAFSRATFGPGARTKGVIDHIRKELAEVEACGNARELEWVDVVILGLDGLTRELVASGLSHDRAATAACQLLVSKQARNEIRDWPDWRTMSSDQAIEHIRR